MSRPIRAFVALLIVSFAFAATACAGADATGPRPSADGTCDVTNPNTCH